MVARSTCWTWQTVSTNVRTTDSIRGSLGAVRVGQGSASGVMPQPYILTSQMDVSKGVPTAIGYSQNRSNDTYKTYTNCKRPSAHNAVLLIVYIGISAAQPASLGPHLCYSS